MATVVGAAVAVGAAGCSRPQSHGNGHNLLLITIETTRADHLGAYGYHRDTTPEIDRFASQGALFEQYSSVSPRTNPSLASLMTSRYPHEHGVRHLLVPLAPENRTLAEILRDAGYATAAVQTHPGLTAASGLAQGFDRYEDDTQAHFTADAALGIVAAWLKDLAGAGKPWFVWVHLMDPHWPYYPPPGWRDRFAPEDPRPIELYRALEAKAARHGDVYFRNAMPPDEVRAFVDLYDAEIRYTDESIGALLDVLEDLGLRRNTVVAISADHGESLGEHDYYFEHGDFGTQAEIHVPLVLVAPERIPAGTRVPWTASSLDLAPTLLDLLDVSAGDAFRGRSLVGLLDPATARDRPCFGEVDEKFHPENTRREVEGVAGKWRWVREGRFKLMYRPRAERAPERLLYDLSTDPGETLDVSALHPEAFRALGEKFDRWLAEDPGSDAGIEMTDEQRERLRSLGYVD